MSIHELLGLLCEQKGAMLGENRQMYYSAFLDGYALARKENGCDADRIFLDSFNGWVARRFKNEGGQGWAKLIQFHSASEHEEWQLFWNLYHEYNERRSRKSSSFAKAKS